MIRWSYVLPRLLVLAACLGFVCFALNPLIHWGVTSAGQSLLGAKFELDEVKTSLSGAKIRLNGIRAADPSSPLENLFEADAVYLNLDAESLMLRRLVVERGHIAGLRFNTARANSGALENANAEQGESDGFPLDDAWLEMFADGAVDALREDLETVQLIETAEERWDGKTDGLKDRVATLKRRAKQFKDRYRNFSGRDPRQVAELLQQAPREVNAMQRELDLVQREIQGLQNAAASELSNLSAARDRDIQKWRERVRVREFNAMKLSRYLLGPTMEKRLGEAMQWVDACQQLAEKTSAPDEREFSDEVIRFSDYTDPPSYLIRELIIDGQMLVNGAACEFAGIATDVAYPPTSHSKPIQMKLKTQGEIDAQITGVLDYRTDRPVQRLQIDCPDLAIPAKRLGKTGKFAIQMGPSRGMVRCAVTLRDGKVKGRIHYVQPTAAFTADASGKLGSRIRDSLQASLAGIDRLEATIDFAGDPRAPEWVVNSALGDQVSNAVKAAAQAELAHQEQRVKAQLDKEIQERVASFQEKALAKQQQLLADLDIDAQQLQKLMNILPQNRIGGLNMPLSLPINGVFSR